MTTMPVTIRFGAGPPDPHPVAHAIRRVAMAAASITALLLPLTLVGLTLASMVW